MEIIRKYLEGIEFYTLKATGESGMSQSGLAILAGVDSSTLLRLEKTLLHEALSEFLKPFVGKELTLLREGAFIDNKPVGNLKIYKSSYCSAVLRHYSLYGQEEDTRRIATYSCMKFLDFGIEKWIQGITGWEDFESKTNSYWYERIKIAMSSNTRPLQRGYFCVYLRMMDLFRQLEQRFDYIIPDINLEKDEYLVPDISIGKMFNEFLRSEDELPKLKRLEFLNSQDVVDFRSPNGKNYNEIEFYNHVYPEYSHPIKNTFMINAYPSKYASIFDYYFEYHWIPERFNGYIKERDPEGYKILKNKINLLTTAEKTVLKNTILRGVIENFLPEGQ